jgi:hypothetical protein
MYYITEASGNAASVLIIIMVMARGLWVLKWADFYSDIRIQYNNVKFIVYKNIHVSEIGLFSTPQLFYTYFYDHARRLRLKKLLYIEIPRNPNGFINHFWIQIPVAVSILNPPQGGFRIETAVTRRFQKLNGQKLTAYM